MQAAIQAPLESLLIADRCQFLVENGLDVDLVPVFDAMVSPRNMAIIATAP
jgi:hypothetical protein